MGNYHREGVSFRNKYSKGLFFLSEMSLRSIWSCSSFFSAHFHFFYFFVNLNFSCCFFRKLFHQLSPLQPGPVPSRVRIIPILSVYPLVKKKVSFSFFLRIATLGSRHPTLWSTGEDASLIVIILTSLHPGSIVVYPTYPKQQPHSITTYLEWFISLY